MLARRAMTRYDWASDAFWASRKLLVFMGELASLGSDGTQGGRGWWGCGPLARMMLRPEVQRNNKSNAALAARYNLFVHLLFRPQNVALATLALKLRTLCRTLHSEQFPCQTLASNMLACYGV